MKPKIKDEDLEKIPLLIIYKQGSKIIADQPEEIINKFEFWAFLKLYTEGYHRRLYRDHFDEDPDDERGES